MKTTVVSILGLALTASAASAATLNVRVEGCTGTCDEADMGPASPWTTNLDVAPDTTVHYRVVGWVTPADTADNQGLALFGFDLAFDCDGVDESLAQASAPLTTTTPGIAEFQIPNGITNPAGFGGTTDVPGMEGKLVQIGGAWNTINNVDTNAPYPIGGPILDLGHDPAVLAVGQLTIPGTASEECHLVLSNLFANVVDPAATETDAFWRVMSATPDPDPENLTMSASCAAAAFVASDPVEGKSLWRTKKNFATLSFGCPVSAPVAGQVLIQEILDGCNYGPDLSSSFALTVEGGNVLRIDEPDPGVLAHQTWYAVRNTGDWAGVAPFEVHFVSMVGDADNNNLINFTDVNLILGQNGQAVPPADPRRDIDGNDLINFTDVNLALNRNGTGAPADPCAP